VLRILNKTSAFLADSAITLPSYSRKSAYFLLFSSLSSNNSVNSYSVM
jgi:hypothetical protein